MDPVTSGQTMNKPLILIVDDIPVNLQVLGSTLSKVNYRIAAATNGQKALDIIKDIKPDLILLDIMMPDIDGYEVCRRLKAAPDTREIPVIFLTAKVETDDIIRGFNIGAVDYITKPINSAELLARVNTHLLIQRQQKQLIELNKLLTLTNKTVESLALEDQLTGMYNRRGFLTLGEQHVKLSLRSDKDFLVFCIDLDNLKAINETNGHHEGDNALKTTAKILFESFREVDIIARFGGDEFVVLAVETGIDNIDVIKTRIYEKINKFNEESKNKYVLAISIGVVSFLKNKDLNIEKLVDLADKELFLRKKNKKEKIIK